MPEESLEDKEKRRKARKKYIKRILIIAIVATVSLIIITAAWKEELENTTSGTRLKWDEKGLRTETTK